MALLTAFELAAELKVTPDTVWRYTRTGRIPSFCLREREYRYDLAAVMAALAEKAQEERQAAKAPSQRRPRMNLKRTALSQIDAFAGRLLPRDDT